ncbi:C3HC zinc finger-like-domain-containing protein [Boeremia exigua]|uniref:C3HC zinc finger-like-domain-containing protein n=1 Tax=Boeremia exigua TaxID=749465 RepID=UPI001E8D621B|nr:C3HC zinc finger-like-domain-containing protein [Boeremia exigua]KAH6633069.1 C3HC zinc finger-like-domain-containing protein [Boeremia exigua]
MTTRAESPPALATTKRKFHKLLDNLTASTSTASLNSSLYESSHNASTGSLFRSGSPEPVAKRPRSSDSIVDRQRQVSEGQARIQALKDQLLTPKRKGTMRVVGTQAQQLASTPRKAPNFQPYSQELFLARLKTFADVRKWTSKPDAISEVEWAKRGWTCDTWNTVACKGGCEKRVAVKLRPKRKSADGQDIEMSEDVSHDVEPSLVSRYAALIIDGHSEDCLWRKTGCQDDIYHIPIASRAKSSAELISRYNFLLAISPDLPLPQNITYPSPSVETLLSRLPPSLFTSSTPTTPPSTPAERTAFAFALFGWTGVRSSRIALAVCNHCFQRLGLWLSADARLREMSSKLDVPPESLRLNLLESHREHCPWKNATVQGNPPDGPIAHMPAWQTLEYMLLGARHKELPRLPDTAHAHAHASHPRNSDSVDLGSDATFPRDSAESAREHGYNDEGDAESLTNKWRKFKAKLKRSTSKRSLKSVKSAKSGRSAWSGRGEGEGEE